MNRSTKHVVRTSKWALLGPSGALALSLSVLSACQSESAEDGDGAAAGGANTGGTSGSSTGGAATGGSVGVGGAATGGLGTGGITSGGTGGIGGSTGGVAAGGTSTGGAATGGATTGGASTGGAATGGASTGGSGTGGTADPSCSQGVWDGGTPEVLSLTGNTFAHDPTMIEANGVFYRFWTGNDIPVATSTDLKHWVNAPSVYKNGYSPWVADWLDDISGETFNFPWAPDVSYFGGKYHIYSSFSAKFGDNISCITHLSTSDIAQGNWTDHGPVICTQGSEKYNAIDADAGVDEDGTPWLAFGSFWDGIMGIKLNPDGSRAGTDMTRLAWASQIEAPVLFHRCGYYYLFVTWGLCCPGEGRTVNQLTYRVAVGRSENIMGPYVDKSGKPMVEGGGTLLVQGDKVQWAAAGHSDVIATGDKIYHLYHAYRQSDGGAQLRIVELPFDEDGWPVPGGP
jgi:arabinan endo-1,5-alpha-L-arabinosidase